MSIPNSNFQLTQPKLSSISSFFFFECAAAVHPNTLLSHIISKQPPHTDLIYANIMYLPYQRKHLVLPFCSAVPAVQACLSHHVLPRHWACLTYWQRPAAEPHAVHPPEARKQWKKITIIIQNVITLKNLHKPITVANQWVELSSQTELDGISFLLNSNQQSKLIFHLVS